MPLNINALIEKSIRWRKDNNRESGGVVIVFEGEVEGWSNELRNPAHWQPGCVAVEVNGACWIATGGNEYHGAERWEPVVALWCVKTPCDNCFYAAPSYRLAAMLAEKHNIATIDWIESGSAAKSLDCPPEINDILAVVVEWPYDEESHKQSIIDDFYDFSAGIENAE